MVFNPTRALGAPATICTVLSLATATWQMLRWSLSGWATISTISPTTNLGSLSLTISSVKPSACNSWFKRATCSSVKKT